MQYQNNARRVDQSHFILACSKTSYASIAKLCYDHIEDMYTFEVPKSGVCWRGGGGGATGLLNKGGGSNKLPGLVTKQQAVEFPQVQASITLLFPSTYTSYSLKPH